ncbi:hypothetical protein [Sphingomonas sp. ABOLG]
MAATHFQTIVVANNYWRA